MIKSKENMFWSDIKNSMRFTENTEENKRKITSKTSSIILASIQLMENYIKGLKSMNAYEAASIIKSDANWIQKGNQEHFLDEQGNKKVIDIGSVYYIDFGNTFCGELAYYHYGLCIGKRNGKVLIIPMTSATKRFENCFHPINNPTNDKKDRQALISEGFAKDCVLLINDTKYISAGRIEEFQCKINTEILHDIQNQVFQVQFPELYIKYKSYDAKIKKDNNIIKSLKKENEKLKNENQRLNNLLKNKTLK